MQSFTLEKDLPQPVPVVYEHLALPKNYIGLQPLLTRLSPVTEWMRDDGKIVHSYETVETFRWLGLPIFNNRIKVDLVESEKNKTLEAFVKSIPNLSLHSTYHFESNGSGTYLSQHVEINVHHWIEKPVMKEALRVQKILLTNLKARLEKFDGQ